MAEIFIPKRISTALRRIYTDRVTVICAPDGTGKSTLLREFTGRTRRSGISIRFITSADSASDCFSQICMHIIGNPSNEPITDRESAILREQFAAAEHKELVLIIDCEYSAETLLGNMRTARLLAEHGNAHFVFICSSISHNYRQLAQSLKFTITDRDSLAMNPDEIAEYARMCAVSVNVSDVYSSCNGAFLGTRLCFMLAQEGLEYTGMNTVGRLLRAVLEEQSVRMHGALVMASAFGELSPDFCAELRSFSSINEFFGAGLIESTAVFGQLKKLNSIIPLIDINLRRRTARFHPILRSAVYRLFLRLPENVRHDMRICFGREYHRTGNDYYAFCEYFLSGEYELAAGIHNNERITYSLLIRSRGMLERYVNECPLSCKPAIPRMLRICAMLMHTDLKPRIQVRFAEIITYITNATEYTPSERRSLLSYAYALRTSEDLYVLDKMGANIMRAYDMFRGRHEYEQSLFSWNMYSPTVFFLLHRRGYSIQTEIAQFTRYQHMYTEMLDHGRYTEIIFSGEAKYVRGDLSGALELLSAAASLATGKYRIATRITAMYCAAKCCLFLGDHMKFFEYVDGIHSIERAYFSREEGNCARLMTGLLRILRGGGTEDSWYALCADDSDPLMNRFTAPYFAMIHTEYLTRSKQYDLLCSNITQYIKSAADAGNEAAGIKLRLFISHALMEVGRYDEAIQYSAEALEAAAENQTPSVPAEFHALYPEFLGQIRGLVGEELQPFIDQVIQTGNVFLRGRETIRSYEITYLSNMRQDNYAEHYLVPLKRLMSSTDGLRRELGLSEKAYAYAIMAASGVSNQEMCSLFGVSPDSIKSSLKRTYTALGVKNRRGLIGLLPTLK